MARRDKKNQQVRNSEGIPNPLGKRLYTLKEASLYLGRSVWGVRELIWGGEIPIVRGDGNRKIFLDTKDLDEYVRQNKSTYR